jgi:hypothetical protein
MKKLITRMLYRLLTQLDASNFKHAVLPSDGLAIDYKFTGAQPTLRHLPIRLSAEFANINDPYIHRLISYLNEAVEELYIINVDLHSAKLDRLLSRRFYL